MIFKLISPFFNDDSGKLIDVNDQTNFPWKESPLTSNVGQNTGEFQSSPEDAVKFPQSSADRHCHLSSHLGDTAADCWYRFLGRIK
jgi:hypothetical protein